MIQRDYLMAIERGNAVKTSCLITLLAMCALGCATITKGSRQSYAFNSEPAGAEVWVNADKRGSTPLILKLYSDRNYNVEVKLAGCGDAKFLITNHFEGGFLGLDLIPGVLLAGPFPIIIDATTGAWFLLDTRGVRIAFDCLGGAPTLTFDRAKSKRKKGEYTP